VAMKTIRGVGSFEKLRGPGFEGHFSKKKGHFKIFLATSPRITRSLNCIMHLNYSASNREFFIFGKIKLLAVE
jgi:hypothetical protein